MPREKGAKTKKQLDREAKEEAEAEAKAAKEEARIKAEADASAAEMRKKAAEEEAIRKAEEQRINKAKGAMTKAANRERILEGDDTKEPFDFWEAYEITKAGIAKGLAAGVEAKCNEFHFLRQRLALERGMVDKSDAGYAARMASLEAVPMPGTTEGPKVSGTLAEDEQCLEALYRATGGEDGEWLRERGWEHVGEWQDLVAKLFYMSSCTDKVAKDDEVEAEVVVRDLCDQSPSFASRKALSQHNRIRHNVRDPMRCFIVSTDCPILRCDPRRDRCRKIIVVEMNTFQQ